MIDLFCFNKNCRKRGPLRLAWVNKGRSEGVFVCPYCGWPYLIDSGYLIYNVAPTLNELKKTLVYCQELDLQVSPEIEGKARNRATIVQKTYDERAKTWAGIRGLIKNYRGNDNRILNLARDFIENRDSPLTVVEFGVGTGWKMAEIKKSLRAGSQIMATDISRSMCHQAFCNLSKIKNGVETHVILDDVTKGTPFPNSCADLVIADKVLHHLRKPERALREAKRIMRDDGKLVVMVPGGKYQLCFTMPNLKHASNLFSSPADEPSQDPLGRFSGDYLREISLKAGIIGLSLHSDYVLYTFKNLFSYFEFMDLVGADARLFWHKTNNRDFVHCEGYKRILEVPTEITVFCEFLTLEGEKL